MIEMIAKPLVARPAARLKSRPCRSKCPFTAAPTVPSWLGVLAAALAGASPVPGFSTSVATLSGARARYARRSGRLSEGPDRRGLTQLRKSNVMADPQNDKAVSADHRVATIARLNDALRQSIHSPGINQVVMTAGVADLIGDTSLFRGFQRRAELLRTVRDYDAFGPDVDPHGERDFGRFEFAGEPLYWKIDYYDRALTYGSPDPTDPDVTTRVLTLLLTHEY